MSGVADSPIQPWLDFRGDNLPAEIPPCQVRGYSHLNLANCTVVCNETSRLLDTESINNLLTCGLWSTLTMMEYYNVNNNPITSRASLEFPQAASLLERFEPLGLDAADYAYVATAQNAVSTCMSIMGSIARAGTYQTEASIQGVCNQQALFPGIQPDFSTDLHQHLQRCMNAICALRTLNPDLGGVGVFISLLLQLSIAVLVFLTLAGLEFLPSSREKKEKSHILAVATALVDFHKHQCYFISALAVAALVLNSQANDTFNSNEPPPFFDIVLSIPLSLNGLVPIVFTLCCVSRYGQMTWHVITLSFVSVALATGSLAASYKWMMKISDTYGDDVISVSNGGGSDGGGIYQHGFPLAKAVCGSRSSNLSLFIQRKDIRFSLVWVIYSNCIAWGLWCVTKHLFTGNLEPSRRNRILELCSSCIPKSAVNRSTRLAFRRLGYCLFILTWSFCFIYHVYLYSLFTRYSLVSSGWTFGQIIAVTVWIPSIVELLYIEYEGPEEASKYKYPPGLQVIKTLVRPSVGLANFELQPSSTPDPLLPRRHSAKNPSA